MIKISEKIVKQGTFLYDKTKSIDVQILETNFKPGSGDFEDQKEIQNDAWGKFYYIKYPSNSSQGSYFNSLDEAINHAKKKLKNLKWIK